MPRGRRWRRGRRIGRFIQPCLLLLLHRGAAHGYSLIEDLNKLPFSGGPLDPSVVYRNLRKMEEEGLVTSAWDVTGSGPPRRVYRLTAQGNEYLGRLAGDLRETKSMLEHFLGAYEEHMREGRGEYH